jgi:hypothetical protein
MLKKARPPVTDETKAKLRELAVARKPWQASTGPRSTAGKARSRANALRHGARANLLVPDAVREAEQARKDGRQVTPEVGWNAVAWLNESGTITGLQRAARIIEAMGTPIIIPP